MYQRIINRSLATLMLISITQFGHAQDYLARDISSNPAYQDGWQNGDNGGFGFGPWDIDASSGTNNLNETISSEFSIEFGLPPQLVQFQQQYQFIQADDDSVFYAISRRFFPNSFIPILQPLPITLSRSFDSIQSFQDGVTFSFIHLPQNSVASPSITFSSQNEDLKIYIPTDLSPRFVSFSFYRSDNRIDRKDVNLDTNETENFEYEFDGFPQSFTMEVSKILGGGLFQNWVFNDLRVEAGTFGSTYHGNDLLARVDVRGTERTYDATIDFRRANTDSKGMIFGRHEIIEPEPLPDEDLALTRQQFELAVDETLEFTSSTVYLEYDPNWLGRVREADIQFVDRITEFETVRIPCQVETFFNTIKFDTDQMGIFIPGGLKSDEIDTKDYWVSF